MHQSAKPRVYEHCVVIAIANASVYIVDGLQIVIIINYEIFQGIVRGVLHRVGPGLEARNLLMLNCAQARNNYEVKEWCIVSLNPFNLLKVR